LKDRRLAALWITHSDEQEQRVASRTILLGPREGGGTVHSRNTSVNPDVDADNLDSGIEPGLRKKRSSVRRTRSQDQSNRR
jgi:hypothetical protein